MSENEEIKNDLITDNYNNKYWYKDGVLHNDNDLPAMIDSFGNQYWYQHGELHRENDKPAIEYANGDKAWYQNDLRHRENGLPAVIHKYRIVEYWEYGEQITEEESLQRKKTRELKQTLTNILPKSSLKPSVKKI